MATRTRPAPSRVARRTAPAPEPAPEPKRAKRSAVANECLCGCGGATGSRFVPGHDARHKSALINIVLAPRGEATAQERRTAEKELAKLGWTEHLEKSRAAREAKAERAAARSNGTVERTPAQKAATAKMRAATAAPAKSKKGRTVVEAEPEEDEEELELDADEDDEEEYDDEDEEEDD